MYLRMPHFGASVLLNSIFTIMSSTRTFWHLTSGSIPIPSNQFYLGNSFIVAGNGWKCSSSYLAMCCRTSGSADDDKTNTYRKIYLNKRWEEPLTALHINYRVFVV